LTNYYDILGINQSASISEIKTAFRSLAKIYHPDKNPAGQDQFKKILLAYETLINPTRKYAYDLKLKYHQNASATHTTGTKTKTWTFEEKEMKRRQYYNEHIKKYEKVNKAKAAHSELKKNYNEYKYILYATPLAVLLFLLVINFATPSHRTDLSNPPANVAPLAVEKATLRMGDAPYTEYFGTQQYDRKANKSLTVKNHSGYDMIVCLFSGKEFLRSCFIKDGFYAEISQLPASVVNIKYASGKKWSYEKTLPEVNVTGAFIEELHFFTSEKALELGPVNEITIVTDENNGFNKIDAKTFFNKTLYDKKN
jgi:curved DNA-binding protein CbpA